ncbi:MAG: DHH family phosphoesterase [Bacillota bacterium]|nr:DHH family phosphoesterase [Bacillota bacterium]
MRKIQKGKLKNNIIISLSFLILIIIGYFFGLVAGTGFLFGIIASLSVYIVFTALPVGKLNAFMNKLPADITANAGNALVKSPFPIAVVSADGTIVWVNDAFSRTISKKAFFGKKINEFEQGVDIAKVKKDTLASGVHVTVGENDKKFIIFGIPVYNENKENVPDQQMYVLYFEEETEFVNLSKLYRDSRPVTGLVLIDNYDEVAAFARSRDKSGVMAEIDKQISEWAEGACALFRQMDNNRYIIVFEEKYLDQIKESKFGILDSIRKITIDKTPVTISIGIGTEGATFAQSYEFAAQALDMALGRGGDQAVIKTKNNYEFYGGRSKGVEKRTKVKSRVIADSLMALIENSDNVLVMGHKYADFDAVGASVGIARISKVAGKRVNIVCNRSTNLAMPLIENLEKMPDYEGVFVDPLTGLDLLRLKTLLVVCDVHSLHYVEFADIVKNAANIVVIDHHRKMTDYIENAVLNYHEPYASSTSEIVTELVQYIDGEGTLLSDEASALLAGIVLDTKNFFFKTGFRTFEAAAYLRKAGADPMEVKKTFQSDFDSYVRKTEFIQNADFYKDKIAISIWNGEPFEDAKTVMAQAADELLSIEGVEASFVLYMVGDNVHISSRSLGTINVQSIMEYLGGGGHMTNAGVQVSGTLDEAKIKLIAAIDRYLAENNGG